MSYNKIILVGNLTRDIELRYSTSGAAIANTAIATTKKFTSNGEKKEEVCFVDITFFGRSGEIANQYLRKGSKILIDGRLKLDQWTNNNGQKRSKHSVIVETMQMLDSKSDNQSSNNFQNGNSSNDQQPQQERQQPPIHYENAQGHPVPPPQQQTQVPPAIDVNEDEIPF